MWVFEKAEAERVGDDGYEREGCGCQRTGRVRERRKEGDRIVEEMTRMFWFEVERKIREKNQKKRDSIHLSKSTPPREPFRYLQLTTQPFFPPTQIFS